MASYGNVTKEQAIENANYLLEIGNLEKIPVIRGAEGPLTGDATVYYPEIHGPEGLGPIRPPETVSGKFLPFSSIFKIIKAFENDITIVDIGRNTTLAMTFLLESDLMQKVNEFFLMGGAFLVPGNVTPLAEANVYGDPTATKIVLSSAQNVSLFPLNVTRYAYVTSSMAEIIRQQSKNPFRTLVPKVINYYIKVYEKLVPGIPGAPIHDVISISALVNPELCSFIYKTVVVDDIIGPGLGVTIADFRPGSSNLLENSTNKVRIAVQFNYQLFYQDFLDVMTGKIVK